MKQRNEKYTFRPRKTYYSEGLVGALGHPWVHLGRFFGKLAPLFDMIVSPSTSSLNLSRLKPLLDPFFSALGASKSRKKKLKPLLDPSWARLGPVLGARGVSDLVWHGTERATMD